MLCHLEKNQLVRKKSARFASIIIIIISKVFLYDETLMSYDTITVDSY